MFGKMDLTDKVKELLDDVNLLDYVSTQDLQIAKDKYIDELGDSLTTEGIDNYDFADFASKELGIEVFDLFDKALFYLLDSRLIYTSDCIDLLQASLLDSFEILDEVNNSGEFELTSFDVNKLAFAVAYHIAYNDLRSDLEFAFIDNALRGLK